MGGMGSLASLMGGPPAEGAGAAGTFPNTI